MIRKEEVFKIGTFTKPHGTKGEIGIRTESDVFDETDEPWIVCEIDGILVPFFIEEYRYKTDSVILVKMEKVDSGEAAREFTNKEVFYPMELVSPEDDLISDMTWDNFIGYRVTDEEKGELGAITEIDESTLNVLFKIEHQGTELLVPAAEEIITSVNYPGKQLTVRLPEGLLDL